MSAELKPCPFCGGEPTHDITHDESLWSHDTVPYRRVRCGQCEIGTDYVCDGYEPTEVEAWNSRASAAMGLVPAGWKLVPVEPTREMWDAVNKLDDQMAAGSYDGRGCSIEQAWNCMLAAAPEPEKEQG